MLKPFGIHTWRQSDSAAQFRNYYQNNTAFWTPQMMNLTGREGIAAAEFPLTYYVAAQFAKVLGYSEAWCRGLHLFLFVLGVYFFYLISLRFIKDPFIAIIPSALLLSTPLCYYYANNFLPNMPAISFVLMGWYFYFRYVMDGKMIAFWMMIALMTVGAMIKASETIHLVAALLGLLQAKYGQKRTFPPHFLRHVFVGTMLGVACIGGWVYYAKWLNKGFGNHMSLLDVLPIWRMSDIDIEYTWGVIKKHWVPVLGHPINWAALILASISLLFPKNWKSPLFFPILLLGVGSLVYGVLWYQAFMVHDYYLLTLTVFPAFVFLLLFSSLASLSWNKPLKWLFSLALVGLVGYNIYYNGQVQVKRTSPSGSEINLEFYTLEPYLRSLGIDRKDIIISVPDPSPNISLYMCNNPGWSDGLNGGINNPKPYIEMGAKYLVAGDSTVLARPEMKPYLHNPIGQHGQFTIYQLALLPEGD
ncbi:MAG: glycosyltransferase family 39 protein [Saprospiraceae bacterium]